MELALLDRLAEVVAAPKAGKTQPNAGASYIAAPAR
jgi:hypothetical protein